MMIGEGREGIVLEMRQKTVIRREKIVVNGYPGYEMSFRGRYKGMKVRVHLRVFFAVKRCYTMIWVGSGSEPFDDVLHFFNSIEITPSDE